MNKVNGDFLRFKYRSTHIDLYHLSGFFGFDDAGKRFYSKNVFAGKLPVPNVFCKTANAVAAHLNLAAVGIKDQHFKIGGFRTLKDKDLIGAYSESSVT